jgi:HEAT repeat protein
VLLVATPAVQANGWEHGAVPYEALVAGLAAADAATRGQAAASLGYRKEARAAAPLLAALARPEPEPAVREALYLALGGLGPAAAARTEPTLRGCPQRETRAELLAACVQALGELGTPGALAVLRGLLAGDAPVLVKARAVDALGRFDDAQAVATLAALAAPAGAVTGGTAALRPRALVALGRTGRADAAPVLLRALAATADEDETVLVARALAQLAQPATAAALAARLETAREPRLRYELTTAIAAAQGEGLVPVLQRQLDDATPAVRLAAVEGLRRRGDRAAVPALERLALRELDALDLARAGLAVDSRATPGKRDGPGAPGPGDTLDIVARCSLAAAALAALHELDAPAGRDVLLRAARVPPARDDDLPAAAHAVYQLRRVAWYGLGYTRSADAVRWLASAAALRDPDPRLRAVALRSLGVLEARAELAHHASMLRDPDAEVRWTAAEVLGLAHVRAAAPALVRTLADPHALVRKAAADSLGWLRHAGARRALAERAQGDADERVRSAAILALSLVDDRGPAPSPAAREAVGPRR